MYLNKKSWKCILIVILYTNIKERRMNQHCKIIGLLVRARENYILKQPCFEQFVNMVKNMYSESIECQPRGENLRFLFFSFSFFFFFFFPHKYSLAFANLDEKVLVEKKIELC